MEFHFPEYAKFHINNVTIKHIGTELYLIFNVNKRQKKSIILCVIYIF